MGIVEILPRPPREVAKRESGRVGDVGISVENGASSRGTVSVDSGLSRFGVRGLEGLDGGEVERTVSRGTMDEIESYFDGHEHGGVQRSESKDDLVKRKNSPASV